MKNAILRESALQKSITKQLQATVILPGRKQNYFTWNKLLKPALKYRILSLSLTYKGECCGTLCIWIVASCRIKANGFAEILMVFDG
jgi:hypothetical protein